MRYVAIGLAVLGGFVLFMADNLYNELATGIDSLDRFPIRGRILLYSFLNGVDPRAIMAIVYNESKGEPSNYLGDLDSSGGPSVGPGQVYRSTAKALGLWSAPLGSSDEDERGLYASLADDEDWGIKAAIAVFKDKLRIAGGNTARAIALYNGNPALPNVQTYQQNALAFISDHYGASLS